MDEPVLKITGQTTEELVEEGERAGYLVDLTQPEDIRSLQEILVHGLKGVLHMLTMLRCWGKLMNVFMPLLMRLWQ